MCRVLAFDVDFGKFAPPPLADVDGFQWQGLLLDPRELFMTDHPASRDMVRKIRSMTDGLAWHAKERFPEYRVLTSYSGNKGLHVYVCFGKAVLGEDARKMGESVLNYFGFELVKGKNFWGHRSHQSILTVEVYPKQGTLKGKDLGNLLRLPLGLNQKSGREGFFYDVRAPIDALVAVDPLLALEDGTVIPE